MEVDEQPIESAQQAIPSEWVNLLLVPNLLIDGVPRVRVDAEVNVDAKTLARLKRVIVQQANDAVSFGFSVEVQGAT